MRLSALRSIVRRNVARAGALTRKKGVRVSLAIVALVAAVMTTVWTGRYGWAIYKLNRGVGDTVFLDG
jgi:hypothetical protein